MSTRTEQGPERAYSTALRIAAAVFGKLRPRVPVTRATEFCTSGNRFYGEYEKAVTIEELLVG